MRTLFFCLFLWIVNFAAAQLPSVFGEVKGGYFWFQEQVLRDIYDTGGPIGEIEVNLCLVNRARWNFFLFADASYFRQTGHSTGLKDYTQIEMYPFSAGVKYAWTIPRFYCLSVYGGGGFRYFFIDIRNDSPYVKARVDDHGWGGVFKWGLLASFGRHFLFDLFTEYSFRKFHMPDVDDPHHVETFSIHAGGWTFGGALGYGF